MSPTGFNASVPPTMAMSGAGGAPTPSRPTFIPARLREADPARAFADVAGLCRHLHRLRGRDGLELRPSTGCYPGSRTFPVFEVLRLTGDDTEYLGCAAVQRLSREGFEDALRAAEPRPESRDVSRHAPERLLVLL
jgi:hypothetical protein